MPVKDPEARRAYDAAYRAAHREEKKAYDAAYYAAHREERKAYDVAYYAAHCEEKRACHADYYYRVGYLRQLNRRADRALAKLEVSS